MPLFLVTSQDTVIQARDYVVKAENASAARDSVSAGHFITESVPETLDILESQIVAVEQLTEITECELDDA